MYHSSRVDTNKKISSAINLTHFNWFQLISTLFNTLIDIKKYQPIFYNFKAYILKISNFWTNGPIIKCHTVLEYILENSRKKLEIKTMPKLQKNTQKYKNTKKCKNVKCTKSTKVQK